MSTVSNVYSSTQNRVCQRHRWYQICIWTRHLISPEVGEKDVMILPLLRHRWWGYSLDRIALTTSHRKSRPCGRRRSGPKQWDRKATHSTLASQLAKGESGICKQVAEKGALMVIFTLAWVLKLASTLR